MTLSTERTRLQPEAVRALVQDPGPWASVYVGLKTEKAFVEKGDPIGLVVETGCRFATPLSYPDTALVATKTGGVATSVLFVIRKRYADAEPAAAADGVAVGDAFYGAR